MNKFSLNLAVAAMTCAAGLSACKDDKKPADTAAPAASTAPAPAPAAEPAKPAEPPAMAPAAPAPEKKSEAAPAEPEKMAAAAPAPEAPKAEAPKPDAPKVADAAPAPAPAAEPAKPADAKPAEAAAPAAPAETKTADAKPADAKPADAAAPATPPPAADAKPADAKPADDSKAESPGGAVTAADATPPAADIKDKTSPPDPVSELAKQKGFKFDGRYRNKDGDPQPIVTKDFMVDWGTWNGFRRYHDACHVCHGPNANGSTFAPALKDSLKTLDYSTFVATVSGGKQENRGGTMFVMPSFGTDKNIMCYLDDIYTYIKARSLYDTSGGKDGMPAGRPNGREDISDDTKKAADECTG